MKRLVMILVAAFVVISSQTYMSGVATAQLFDGAGGEACQGIGDAGSGACDEDGATSTINSTLGNIIGLLSIIVGIAGVIMVIVAGFKYITAGGEASGVKSAKDTLVYALVGLVIAALAQVLVQFVFKETTSASSNNSTEQTQRPIRAAQ